MEYIYLDAASTTPVREEVAEAVNRMMTEEFGNPSSLHCLGVKAEKEVKLARARVAESIGAHPSQIFFTSGGTEANNLAIQGLTRTRGTSITTKIEHPSVLETFNSLERQGQKVNYLGVDSGGKIDLDELKKVLGPETRLVSLALVNNEIGTIQPMEEVIKNIREKAPKALIHTDAVQAWGKIPLSVQKLQVDSLTLSAHKSRGPKGVGALYIKKPELLQPVLQGGGQEEGVRSGTENTPGIAGMGVAATLLPGEEGLRALRETREDFFQGIKEKWPGVVRIGPESGEGAPHILSLSFPGLPAQVLLQAFSEQGVFVSAGSACSSRNKETSYVLQNLGLEKEILESALRFSFLEDIKLEQSREAVKRMIRVIKRLEKVMGNV